MKKPDSFLDMRGHMGPVSLLKAAKAREDLHPGQRLEIIGTDGQTRQDLLDVVDKRRFQVVKLRGDDTFYRMVLERKSASPQLNKRREFGLRG